MLNGTAGVFCVLIVVVLLKRDLEARGHSGDCWLYRAVEYVAERVLIPGNPCNNDILVSRVSYTATIDRR